MSDSYSEQLYELRKSWAELRLKEIRKDMKYFRKCIKNYTALLEDAIDVSIDLETIIKERYEDI